MDLNADGKIDILSGSYAPKRSGGPMVGLFHVLWGTEGGFKQPAVLNGADDKPLVIPAGNPGHRADVDRICTRPTAVDLDGDGKLDIVSGNFKGTFAVFAGQGDGKFAPTSTWLETADGKPLMVQAHSDPCFVDWDGDGDQDLLSGTGSGGVFLCLNEGSAKQAQFAKPVAVVPTLQGGRGYFGDGPLKLGNAHITAPQSSTRVSVADVNGDGKFDLLVGDNLSLTFLAEGVEDEETASKKLEALNRLMAKTTEQLFSSKSAEDKSVLRDRLQEMRQQRSEIVRTERTGFVWVLYQK